MPHGHPCRCPHGAEVVDSVGSLMVVDGMDVWNIFKRVAKIFCFKGHGWNKVFYKGNGWNKVLYKGNGCKVMDAWRNLLT